MTKKTTVITAISVCITITASVIFIVSWSACACIIWTDKDHARVAVTSFGFKLNNVSVLSTKAGAEIEKYYAEFVTSELLSRWIQNPSEAPGRSASSSWPSHVYIDSIEKTSDITYEVEGRIMLMSSEKVTNKKGDWVGEVPINVTVTKTDGDWLISDFEQLITK